MTLFGQVMDSAVWQYEILGNTVLNFSIAFAAFLGFLVVFKVFQWGILARLKKLAEKTKTDIDDTLIQIVRTLKPPFYSFLAFFFALSFLDIQAGFQTFINAILIIWITAQVVIAAQILISYVVRKSLKEEEDASARSAINALQVIIKGLLWLGAVLMILSNIGVDITSLIAGLGIGGIAIALALQNILSDLFSSFAIYFDKPFQPGDFIVTGEHMGVVEKIGIKTTRLRALQGEEIVISNKELTSARIQNFKHMEERRIVFEFGVEYGTTNTLLEEIPGIIKDIMDPLENARLDRAHFKSFGDSALMYEVVYYVGSGDYTFYMDTQQTINLKIKDAFEKKGIAMAFPTQTVYLHKA